jgi:hypothetical protein
MLFEVGAEVTLMKVGPPVKAPELGPDRNAYIAEEVIQATIVAINPDCGGEDGDGPITATAIDQNNHPLIFHGDQDGRMWSSPDRSGEELFMSSECPEVFWPQLGERSGYLPLLHPVSWNL